MGACFSTTNDNVVNTTTTTTHTNLHRGSNDNGSGGGVAGVTVGTSSAAVSNDGTGGRRRVEEEARLNNTTAPYHATGTTNVATTVVGGDTSSHHHATATSTTTNTTTTAASAEQQQQHEQEQVERLIEQIRGMESLFQSLLGQAFQYQHDFPGNRRDGSQQQQQGGLNREGGAPPASTKAVRQLPTVIVSNEDLYDESNRECCICFEENHLEDKVARLPCGHLYHRPCISSWLKKHCTCPICRFELETDDPLYERGRIERMKHRKPRYHKYELERMSPKELSELVQRLQLRKESLLGLSEKSDIIDVLLKCGKIDVISTTGLDQVQLAEFTLSDLRRMGVGKLKKTMANAGVFFDPVDVVEKEDMVVIFVNSGRLTVLPEEGEEEEEDNLNNNGGGGKGEEGVGGAASSSGPAAGGRPEAEVPCDDEEMSLEPEAEQNMDMADQQRNPHEEGGSASSSRNGTSAPTGNATSSSVPQALPTSSSAAAATEASNPPSSSSSSSSSARVSGNNDLASRSISQLKAVARELGVDVSDCIEKREIVDRVADAVTANRNRNPR